MAIKISQLPAGTTPTGTELVPAVQSGVTVSLTSQQIANVGTAGLTAVDSGTANAYILTTNKPISVSANQVISFVALHPNTGPSTANLNGTGTIPINDSAGNALSGGEISGPVVMLIVAGATSWQLLWALPLINKRTAAELAAAQIPTNYTYTPGIAFRFGVDPTGVADSTVPIQNWINACWAMYQFQDGQGLWNGGGGAVPVLQLPPGKFRVTGTMFLPSGCTLKGTGHPAHTVNHTRLVMDSTGVVPNITWTAATVWVVGDIVTVGNGFWYFCTVGGLGGTGTVFNVTVGSNTTDGAASWTNEGAIGAGGSDNRNKPMFKFRRGTLPGVGPGPGGTLQNAGCGSSIQELEFWFVAPNDTFSNPLGAAGVTSNQRSYPTGAVFGLDVDMTDSRIIDCVFQNSICPIWTQGVSTTSATRGDGFTGNRGINIYVENCEFDASSAHIWASGSFLQIIFKHCQFFASAQYIYNCTGKVVYQGCYFQDGEVLDYGLGLGGGASPAANAMASMSILGSDIEAPNSTFFLQAVGVALVNVAANSCLTAATVGGIYLRHCVGGAVTGNTFDSQGANVPAGSGFTTFHACVKLDGCKNMMVLGNTISASFGATYGGFGILTGTQDGVTSTGNYVAGNSLTPGYTGAAFNGLPRGINLATTDILGVNYLPATYVAQKHGALADTRQAIAATTTTTIDASQGNAFEINIGSASAFTMANPLSPTEGQIITVMFINGTGGAVGTISFGTAWKVVASAVTPAAGGNVTLMFKFNGTFWYEMFRSAASTPN